MAFDVMATGDEFCVQSNKSSLNGNEFRWNGTLDQLKSYFAQDLNLSGKWNSRSGGVWLFSAPEFDVKR